MTIEQILNAARSANWFSALGVAETSSDVLAINDLEGWRNHVREASALEFGLTYTGEPGIQLPEFEWLSAECPNPNAHLQRQLDALEPGSAIQREVRKNKLAAYRVVIEHMGSVPESPWFVIEGVDLRNAVSNSAIHTFGMSAIEAVLDSPGVWTRALEFYARGMWPCGYSASQRKLVVT